MNSNILNLISNTLKVGFLLSIAVLALFVVHNSYLINQPLMASAVTFDLLITLPIAYWFFIRKTKISKLTVAGLSTFGTIFAYFILPDNNRQFFNYLLYFAFPVIELGFLTYAGLTIYKARKTYKLLYEKRGDFLETLRETLTAEFPSQILAKAVSFEIAEFYYAFFSWKAKRGEQFYTYHKKNGTAALLTVIGFIIAVETFVLHILLAKWNVTISWILTAFSLYFLFQIFAHGKAIFLRPLEITGEKLFVRCGLFGDAVIDLANIEKIETVIQPLESEKNAVILSALGKFTAPNLKISLRDAAILNGIYGRRKDFETIFLAIDEAEKFKGTIEQSK